jgi:hypothetical protein
MLNMFFVACDNCVSRETIIEVIRHGWLIVYVAKHENDELWLDVAKRRGANVFISADFDVENFALNRNLDFIRIPQKVGHDEQARRVVQEMEKLRRKKIDALNTGVS